MPGMELNDNAMAYNIGDVVGINRAFQQVTENDDMQFVANSLGAYALQSATPRRRIQQRLSPLGYVKNVWPVEDDPRMYKRESLWKNNWHLVIKHTLKRDFALGCTNSPGSMSTICISVPDPQEQGLLSKTARDALIELASPALTWLPPTCATIIRDNYPDPFIRGNVTQAEAVVEFLKSPRAVAAVPTLGLGAAPGSRFGLSTDWSLIPDTDLPLASTILNAFQGGNEGIDSNSKPLRAVPTTQALVPRQLTQQVLQTRAGKDRWKVAEGIKSELKKIVEAENKELVERGTLGPSDLSNIWDPSGRAYMAAVNATPTWNRPVLGTTPGMSKVGTSNSIAALTLEGLKDMVHFDDPNSSNKWVLVKRKGRPMWFQQPGVCRVWRKLARARKEF
ncbi:hypothetical protein BU23DRAFT_566057 [Bimuria novae-zelandiae CBS 107.79]|uniref:Uncharacterized protein n=1 Tax=Bimuria novae-zelandiae CBS 107.79 TaxID=1447943 RepID=A0A6A5VGS5_9PLEO|nr:hypothetical protein BU23DRAFT_566057 [Bimuria novae-zelandiae CBS 107.79]